MRARVRMRHDVTCLSKTKLALDNLEVIQHACSSFLDLLALAARLALLASTILLLGPAPQ